MTAMDDETRAAFARMDRYFELSQAQFLELRDEVRELRGEVETLRSRVDRLERVTNERFDDVSDQLRTLRQSQQYANERLAELRDQVARHGDPVGQALDNVVRLFDRDGSPLGTFGRRGEGPGEFGSIVRVGWMGDTLWVWDGRLQRATFADRSLTYLASMQPRVGSSALLDHDHADFVPHALLAFIARDTLVVYGDVRGSRAGDALALAAPDGRLLGLIAGVMTPEDDRTIPLAGGGRMDGDPFATQPRSAVSPGGRYVAVARNHYDGAAGAAFTVALMSATSDTVFQVRLDYSRGCSSQPARSLRIWFSMSRDRRSHASDCRREQTSWLPGVTACGSSFVTRMTSRASHTTEFPFHSRLRRLTFELN
jgi:hypothetical protein